MRGRLAARPPSMERAVLTPSAATVSRPIVEELYAEALVLADDVRAAFSAGAVGPELEDIADGGIEGPGREREASIRLALSSEGLKTTTRMMHVLAWLLNQRAFHSGELSEGQVLLSGTLPADCAAEPRALALLEPQLRALIERSVQLHGRIARLDQAWRGGDAASPANSLRERLERSLGDF